MFTPTKPYKQHVPNCVYFDPVERIQIGFDKYQWMLMMGYHYTYHPTLQSLVDRFTDEETREWPFMSETRFYKASGHLRKRVEGIMNELNQNYKELAMRINTIIYEKNSKRDEVNHSEDEENE